jgi:hypothetical protein
MPPKEDPLVRFWRKVDKDGPVPLLRPDLGPCWLWTGRVKANGYGTFFPSRRECWSAHRWAYAALVGPIPEGLHLDHLCERPRCVNPAHLDPVSGWVNQARGLNPFVHAEHRERLLAESRAYRIRVLGQPPSRVTRTASGAIGVYPSGRRWVASARIDGRVYYIGSFATVEEARDARADYLASLDRPNPRTTR